MAQGLNAGLENRAIRADDLGAMAPQQEQEIGLGWARRAVSSSRGALEVEAKKMLLSMANARTMN
jgi:hypothetical protein